jgi:hypothetical protein
LVLPLVMVGITLASAPCAARHARTRSAAVDHRHRVVGAAHAAGAHRVEDGGADVAGQARQFVVALELHAGLELLGLVARQRRLATMRRVRRSAVGGHRRSSSVTGSWAMAGASSGGASGCAPCRGWWG